MMLEGELWRRAQARREAEVTANMAEADRLLLPLVLSLARLAAQRDVRVATASIGGEEGL